MTLALNPPQNPKILLAAPKTYSLSNVSHPTGMGGAGSTIKDFRERRKEARFRVKDGALIAPNLERRKYWKMIDVSRSGASFRYISFEDISNSASLDIATPDLHFMLENVPFRSISDIDLSGISSPLKLRRHSVEFMTLTDFQRNLLEQFIQQYTVDNMA
jgi:hypothetical protein